MHTPIADRLDRLAVIAWGFTLAALCLLASVVSAYVAVLLARVLGHIAADQPGVFMAAAVGGFMWLYVRLAFRQRRWN